LGIDPGEVYLGPGENVTCDVKIEVINYNPEPYYIWLWLEGVPLEWTAKLNKTYFRTVSSVERCTLSISISEDSPVGISRPIYISGFWRNGNITGWVGYFPRYYKTQINIIGPDLRISENGIDTVNNKPVEGQSIGLMATIHNIGDVSASDISVRFLVDDRQLGEVQNIPLLMPEKSILIFGSWRAIIGNHTITVEVDYENSIDEYSEENNVATTTISVEEEPSKWVEYSTALPFILCIPLISILRNKRIKKNQKE
jgi:hypothetical protein